MSSRALWTAATVLGLAPLAHLAFGCTSSAAPVAVSDAEATCSGSVADTVGAPCAASGLVCSPQYACGILPAIATCTCTGGAFACVDVTGKALAVGGSPACPAPSATEVCPATEVLANQHACTEFGLECAYPSTCSNGTQYDQCECFTGTLPDGGMGLLFQCPSPCDSGAAAFDAAPTARNAATFPDAMAIDAAHAAADAPRTDAPTD